MRAAAAGAVLGALLALGVLWLAACAPVAQEPADACPCPDGQRCETVAPDATACVLRGLP